MKNFAHNLLKSYARNFPIRKGKMRVVASAWKPLSFGQYHRQVQLKQADIKMDCDLTKLIQRQIYFFGCYEEEMTDLWIHLSKDSSTIFDVGANVCLYSLLAARKNPAATVHAFEPTPSLVEIIQTNLKLNDLQNVKINMVAVGKEKGQAFLHRCTGTDQSNEGMNFISPSGQDEFDVATEVVSLDDYCREQNITTVDLMKMDIEGGEYNALLGCQTLLQNKAITCIFMELAEWAANRSGSSTVNIKRLLWEHDYHIYALKSGKLVPVTNREVGDEDNVVAFAHRPMPLLAQMS